MKKKYEWLIFDPTQWTVLGAHFSNMASQGWLVDKISWNYIRYQRCEPKILEFVVAIYPELKAFENADKQKVAQYISQEVNKGWQLAVSKQNIQVFYKDPGLNLEPISRSFQIDNINAQKKMETISSVLLLAVNAWNVYGMFPLSYTRLHSNTGVFGMIFLPALLVLLAGHLYRNVRFHRWYRKAQQDSVYPAKSMRWLKRKGWLLGILLGVLTVGMFGAIFLDAKHKSFMSVMVLIPIIL
jgi:hypothetical protein